VTSVKGTFGEFQGVIQYTEGEVESVAASAEVAVASVDTGNEKRDDHLRNEDFFDAETYPTITFVSTGAEGDLPDITLYGDLTIRGTTKPVALKGQLNGPVTNPWGQTVIGLELETTINRQDFGVAWSKTLDEGGLVVGDQVKLQIALEAIQQSGEE
jgi:polyisoprenoid-binding protein YceI